MKNILHYLKYRLGIAGAITQTSVAEQEVLVKYATEKKRAAEIGAYHGFNTRRIRQALAPDGVLLVIDPYFRDKFDIRGLTWARRIAHREGGKISNAKVTWIETTSEKAPQHRSVVPYLPIDFIFIDGDHSFEGLQGDWEAWSRHIQTDGIVALHDSFNRNNCGSEKFTRERILKDQNFKLLEIVDSLTVLRCIT